MNKPEREGFKDDKVEPVETEEVQTEADRMVAEAEALPEWPMVIKLLHKPLVKSKTETLHELTFREPTAMDIIRCGGNPCRLEITEVTGGKVIYNAVIDDAKMIVLMANLAGLVEPQLQKLDPRDYNSCAYRLRSFFLPEQGVW